MIVALRIKTGGWGGGAARGGYTRRRPPHPPALAAPRGTHLEREHPDGILARREERHRERLTGSERERGHDERDGVLVHGSRRQRRIDLETLHRPVRLRRRARAFHPASGVGEVGLGLLALLGRHLI